MSGTDRVSTSMNSGNAQATAIAAPTRKAGLRPIRSAARPVASITGIWMALMPTRIHSIVAVGTPSWVVP
jgi:hypothetical protein